MPRTGWTQSTVPNGDDQNAYIVVDDFGRNARVYRETDAETADLETVILDLLEGHFQGGQGLRSGFVKFTSQTALFFRTQGQELARKAAQVVLNALLFSNVVIETDKTSDLARSVGEGDGASVQVAGAAIGHDVTREVFEGSVGGDRVLQGLFGGIAIFEAHQGKDVFDRNRAG